MKALALIAILPCLIALSAPGLAVAQNEKKEDKSAGQRARELEEAAQRFFRALEENQKRAAEMAQQPGQQKFQRLPGRFGKNAAPTNRLGVRLQTPDDTLVAQLGLADGNGMLLAEVPEGSVAAKAGFLANDILLKLDGKDVSSTLIEFTTALNLIKTDTPVDAVVLRMGKEETIKGLKLPDVPADPRANPFNRRIQFNLRLAAPKD